MKKNVIAIGIILIPIICLICYGNKTRQAILLYQAVYASFSPAMYFDTEDIQSLAANLVSLEYKEQYNDLHQYGFTLPEAFCLPEVEEYKEYGLKLCLICVSQGHGGSFSYTELYEMQKRVIVALTVKSFYRQ